MQPAVHMWRKQCAASQGLIRSVSILLMNNMVASFQEPATAAAICQAVEKAGYGAAPVNAGSAAGNCSGQSCSVNGKNRRAAAGGEDAFVDHETPKMRRRLIASLCLLLPLMYVSMGHMMWNWPLPEILAGNHVAMGLFQLLFTTGIMVINQKFLSAGLKGLADKDAEYGYPGCIRLGCFLLLQRLCPSCHGLLPGSGRYGICHALYA